MLRGKLNIENYGNGLCMKKNVHEVETRVDRTKYKNIFKNVLGGKIS